MNNKITGSIVIGHGYLSIPSGLNSSNKWTKTNRMQKHNLSLCCLQEELLNNKNRYCLRVKVGKGYSKQAGIAILMSNKGDFKPKLIKKDN